MVFNSVAVFVGLRYARASSSNDFIAFINFFSVMGIALGLMALITVSSVMNGFELQLKQRILGVTPHILLSTHDPEPALNRAIEHSESIIASSQFLESEGIVQSQSELKGVFVQGINPDEYQVYQTIESNMLYGSLNDLKPGAYQLVMGRALASQLKIRIGDSVRIIMSGASTYGPFGRMPAQRKFVLSGLYEVGSELDDKIIVMNIDDSRKLMRKKLKDVGKTRLFLADAFRYQQVKQQLSEFDLKIEDWRSRQGPLFDAVKMEKNMMALMLLLIIAVAAFNIVSALVMVVSEKNGDIAILRTQGMDDTHVMVIFMINGAYNGVKGCLIGLTLGLLITTQLNFVLNLLGIQLLPGVNGEGLPIDLQWSQVLMMSGSCLVFCLLATLYPAWRAMKQQPADALRCE